MTITDWLHSIWPWAYGVPIAILFTIAIVTEERADARDASRDRHPSRGA